MSSAHRLFFSRHFLNFFAALVFLANIRGAALRQK